MFEMNASQCSLDIKTLGEFSRARELTSEILHHAHAGLSALTLLGTSPFNESSSPYIDKIRRVRIAIAAVCCVAYVMRYAKRLIPSMTLISVMSPDSYY